jgi:spore coat polysaccharide biosynthesis predicted glycosyltransferase SpsG
MKALLGWEMGGGGGHIHRLTAIARLLTEHQIEPVLVLKNPNHRGIKLPWKVLQAPSPIPKTFDGQSDITSHRFTDLLYLFGFSDSLVTEMVRPHYEFGTLENVLSGRASAIHHGGSTTSIAALLAGIPQLIFPQHQEQVLRAEALEEMGVAIMLIFLSKITYLSMLQFQYAYRAARNYNYLRLSIPVRYVTTDPSV